MEYTGLPFDTAEMFLNCPSISVLAVQVGQDTSSEDWECLPAGQAVQLVEPVLTVVLPLSHVLQDDAPLKGWYWPLLQFWQVPELCSECLPAAQAVQLSGDTEPSSEVV